jgi:hypothetical protein
MNSVRIYEREATPRIEIGQIWIRLVLHTQPTEADREAERCFRRLAEAIGNSDKLPENYVLSIFRVDEKDEYLFGTLPQIRNGFVYEGLDEIRTYIDSAVSELKTPDVI